MAAAPVAPSLRVCLLELQCHAGFAAQREVATNRYQCCSDVPHILV